MKDTLIQLQTDLTAALASVTTTDALEAVRVEYLGRKGKLADLMKGIATLSVDEKKVIGQVANDVKTAMESAFLVATAAIGDKETAARLEREWLDVSLPGTLPGVGHLHLTTQAINDITDIFTTLGFTRARHPEVDWDYYAFEALNMPGDHPARDDWETFFIEEKSEKEKVKSGTQEARVMTGAKGKVVLTPHTSNGQVREMEKGVLPIRMMSIGKCYRRQSTARHCPMFHQFEGFVIDKTSSVTDLKGVCEYFAKRYFGADRVTRLRPYHFRFTEPSFELDISCGVCGGKGNIGGVKCKLCKEGWLELGGAGMVHPNVIKAGGLDPEEYSGFAFGWGLERTMMMRAGVNIDDIRILYRNDFRFIRQF